jgi:hypothetical protein
MSPVSKSPEKRTAADAGAENDAVKKIHARNTVSLVLRAEKRRSQGGRRVLSPIMAGLTL